MFSKVLVANRGEIAVRVIRALEELGVASVAVYSEVDRGALHASRADEAYLIGGYLDVDRILEVIAESGAEAVHPGYGFLAENAGFAKACEEAGVVFIGPPASAIEAMGSKTRARELMQEAGVPIVPGTTEPVPDLDAAREAAQEIGYPVAVKAAGGGGGKGFRVAMTEDDLEGAFEGASGEGERFFSDPTVYLERYLPDPRHVEVQVLADGHGTTIHLGERDCSIQRRHQKLIEEAPAPVADDELRARIGKIATDAAEAVGYRGAGTIEGLFQDGEYFFLEMNTRVQVEHCVTEMVTGIDIVREGIRIAAGEPLSVAQDDVELRGHAIECRINAEDAARNFAPAPGRIGAYREPSGPGVRVDSGVTTGGEISPSYDPMIAKLIVWDTTRELATARMRRALGEYEIEGLTTLIPFHRALLATEQWANAETCRDLLEDPDWLEATATDAGTGARRSGGLRQPGLHRRGLRPPLRREGDRPAPDRLQQRHGHAQAAAPRPGRSGRGRRRRRRARVPDAGHGAARRRRAGRHRRGGRAHRRRRGHEDGERDHRPQGRHRRRAPHPGRRRRRHGRHPRGHHRVMTRSWVAGPEETETIARLLVAFRDHLGERMPPAEEMLASVERIIAERDSEFLLASVDESSPPAAVLQLRFRWSVWKSAPDAWIEDVFVSEDARRGGLGDALVNLAFERARIRGARRIELDCFEDNDPALALYERNGFSRHSKGRSRALLLGRKL